MKTIILSLLILAALALTVPAEAQQIRAYSGEQTTSYNGGTNVIPVLSTNRYFSIDVPRSEEVVLWCNYKWHAAPSAGDATSLSVDFFRGIDSGKYETNAWFTWVPAGNSTTPSSTATNISLLGVGYLRARVKGFSTNAIATNVVFSYGFKN